MKNLILPLIPFMLPMLMTSCTEEIDIDLNASQSQIVIEGNITTNAEPARIRITRSVNFNEENVFPAVSGASVKLSDGQGNFELVPETSPGIYSTGTIQGISGERYQLLVEVEGLEFSAYSGIPEPVPFGELIVRMLDEKAPGGPGSFGSSSNCDVFVKFADPEGISNYYLFLEFVNGRYASDYAFDDRLTDGLEIERRLSRSGRVLESGDTLQIVMQCIDKQVYDYFNSFGNLRGGPSGSSTPANPYTNIEGAVLGYFSAHTTEIKQVIIE
jgi:hypothetical protein